MINNNDIQKIIQNYDKSDITIGVLGSHSALDICRGAKDEGFNTIVICEKGREKTYDHYFKSKNKTGIIDQTVILNNFKDILNLDVQKKLRENNTIFVPHRSFEVYINDYQKIEDDFLVPMFGSRNLLKAEERDHKNNQYDLLKKANIRMPIIFSDPKEIDRICIVKLPEKSRSFERAFFYCSSYEEFKSAIDAKIKSKEIDENSINNTVIEEFILGTLVNFNYFYSPINNRLELLGTDTRRQTNIDGILRLPAKFQIKNEVREKFEESGHIAVTILESMLEIVFELGEKFVKASRQEHKPGIIGPFALQSAILPGPPRKEIVVFDVSLRVQGSPGTRYTPYTGYLHGESISTGRRISMELKDAIAQAKLLEVLT